MAKRLRGTWLAPLFILASSGGVLAASCSRTAVDIPPPAPAAPECVVDQDCEGFGDLCNPVVCDYAALVEAAGGASGGGLCVELAPVDCDDNDPCTLDACNAEDGTCAYAPAAVDLDGDGFKGPREGTLAGDPDSCGNDCDDTSPLAFPGGMETCDGVDNDCNGVVDDGAEFVPLGGEAVRISGNIAPTGTEGLAFNGSHYAATYWGSAGSFTSYRQLLNDDGSSFVPEEPIVLVNADNSGGPIRWIGDRFGLAWQDRRDGDYEIYFTLMDSVGNKALVDTRLSFAFGFSVNPAMTWTGNRFVVVWQDERAGKFDIFGQLIGADGVLEGGDERMTDDGSFEAEAPAIAAGTNTLGLAWTAVGNSNQVRFAVYDFDLNPLTGSIALSGTFGDARDPVVVDNGGQYVVAWYDTEASPAAIYGAVINPDGSIAVASTALTSPGAGRSRYPSLLPLGDRLLLVYADDRDQNSGYEIYSRMLNADLSPAGDELRLTDAPFDSTYPVAAFGAEGDVGVLFRDERENGTDHQFFSRLGCVAEAN